MVQLSRTVDYFEETVNRFMKNNEFNRRTLLWMIFIAYKKRKSKQINKNRWDKTHLNITYHELTTAERPMKKGHVAYPVPPLIPQNTKLVNPRPRQVHSATLRRRPFSSVYELLLCGAVDRNFKKLKKEMKPVNMYLKALSSRCSNRKKWKKY